MEIETVEGSKICRLVVEDVYGEAVQDGQDGLLIRAHDAQGDRVELELDFLQLADVLGDVSDRIKVRGMDGWLLDAVSEPGVLEFGPGPPRIAGEAGEEETDQENPTSEA
ncbi:MAG: hypothetical protein ABIP48_30490 [Planctomycetota bacterium]